MTLTEALKQSKLVRRKAWIWSRYWRYEPDVKVYHPEGRPCVWWGDSNAPRTNHLDNRVSFEDAIADDWEALELTP